VSDRGLNLLCGRAGSGLTATDLQYAYISPPNNTQLGWPIGSFRDVKGEGEIWGNIGCLHFT